MKPTHTKFPRASQSQYDLGRMSRHTRPLIYSKHPSRRSPTWRPCLSRIRDQPPHQPLLWNKTTIPPQLVRTKRFRQKNPRPHTSQASLQPRNLSSTGFTFPDHLIEDPQKRNHNFPKIRPTQNKHLSPRPGSKKSPTPLRFQSVRSRTYIPQKHRKYYLSRIRDTFRSSVTLCPQQIPLPLATYLIASWTRPSPYPSERF